LPMVIVKTTKQAGVATVRAADVSAGPLYTASLNIFTCYPKLKPFCPGLPGNAAKPGSFEANAHYRAAKIFGHREISANFGGHVIRQAKHKAVIRYQAHHRNRAGHHPVAGGHFL
ncbi:MAG: hypothetical protein KDD10_29740, partial [Phaeodactylibacter sp.]|nr:hypothetical protein [Phaeodactylibacter sp.]